jgi:predicted CXXCH cytochrome family protein
MHRSWVAAAIILAALLGGCSPAGDSGSSAQGQYVGEETCAGCHEAQHKAWTGSHHDLAMQDASEQTVLGNFADARFSYAGVTSRFFRRDGKFFVSTDGPDGKLADFEIKHTFGVEPLQQYLIELPGGRLQALSIAWDVKGKRWFHLYPGERIDYRDELHWTGLAQNWNYMCGECHATDYHKNYDAGTGTFKTTASRFDVGCQACHGPASRHADWARRAGDRATQASHGSRKQDFDIDLAARDSRLQIETCARCHSRRVTLSADYRHGKPLMDTHLPALLSESLYFADGQIRDEVYVYGSFLQSRMHAKGVRCSDCHEPHSTKTRASGNALCVTCHNATATGAGAHIDASGLKRKDYDSPAHHFHKAGKPGAQCVDCHAPARTYMVVDPRRDHSFRIPRPDVSVAIGAPNACTGCHSKQSAQWAADKVAKWYGPDRRKEPHYGLALDAGRQAKPGALKGLVALADDAAQPAIVRATALQLLSTYPGRSALAALQRGLRDADPLVRLAAVTGQERLPPDQRAAALAPLLGDPVRAVRMEVARLLAPAAAALAAADKERLNHALAEFETVQRENADRPEAHLNLGNLHLARGEAALAEAAYRKAIALDAHFVPAYANLADLYRTQKRDADSEKMLREGLRVAPKAASLREALGLALVRQSRKDLALAEFANAVRVEPDNSRHTYIYAVALDSAGRRAEAIRILKAAAAKRGDRDVLLALASFSSQAGDRAGAEAVMRMLASINPDDPALDEYARLPR